MVWRCRRWSYWNMSQSADGGTCSIAMGRHWDSSRWTGSGPNIGFTDPKYVSRCPCSCCTAVYFRLARTATWRGARRSKLCISIFVVRGAEFYGGEFVCRTPPLFLGVIKPRHGNRSRRLNHRTAARRRCARGVFSAEQRAARRMSCAPRNPGRDRLVL